MTPETRDIIIEIVKTLGSLVTLVLVAWVRHSVHRVDKKMNTMSTDVRLIKSAPSRETVVHIVPIDETGRGGDDAQA